MRREVMSAKRFGMMAAVLMAAAGGAVAAPDVPPTAAGGGAAQRPRVAANAEHYVGAKVVRVEVGSARGLLALQAVCETILNCTPSERPQDAVIMADKWEAFVALGLPYVVIDADPAGTITRSMDEIERLAAQRDTSWFQTFRRLSEIDAKLTEYAASYPNLVTPINIGNSIQSRAINGIRITGPDTASNPRATRPQLVFNGTQHAREWINPMTVMFIANQLVEGYATNARVKSILDNAEVVIIPVVNPDGFEYSWNTQRLWRKNRRANSGGSFGVDNNRNWGFQWGGQGASSTPSNDTYRGTAAFSEPETQRIRDFLIGNPRTEVHIDYHSYAELILSPWAYTSSLPPDSALFNTLNTTFQSAIASVYGRVYDAGPTYTTIYPASGASMDWAYGARGIKAWGVELRGTSFTPPASEIIPCGEENFAGILPLAEWALNQLVISFPDGRPTLAGPGAAVGIRVRIANGSSNLIAGSGVVAYRRGTSGAFTTAALVDLGGGLFRADIPAINADGTTQYYIQATADQTNRQMRSPLDAPAAMYSYTTQGTCAADYNGDLMIDFFDYLDFAGDFAQEVIRADFNSDGAVDFFDYLDFVSAFSIGC